MKKILTLALVLLLAGCTSAGPFVTSVSVVILAAQRASA